MVVGENFFDRVSEIEQNQAIFDDGALLAFANENNKVLSVSICGKSFIPVVGVQRDRSAGTKGRILLECKDPLYGPVAYLVDERSESLVYRFVENHPSSKGSDPT